MALTEPGGGSDLQAMRTTARRDGDHYVVNGTKTWITNARRSQLIALLCKTDPAATPAHKGVSILLAEHGPGFAVSRDLPKLGYKGIESCADMATKLEAARQLTLYAARRYDCGGRADLEAGMAKLFASEAAMEIALNALRIHGGYGYSTEFDVERYFRDAPLMIVGEGTNEIQRDVIARQLVQRYPAGS
jgi:alkylation response protein AidB-like acyl-CoA dehydrogenase